jgi:hypothetical protein
LGNVSIQGYQKTFGRPLRDEEWKYKPPMIGLGAATTANMAPKVAVIMDDFML